MMNREGEKKNWTTIDGDVMWWIELNWIELQKWWRWIEKYVVMDINRKYELWMTMNIKHREKHFYLLLLLVLNSGSNNFLIENVCYMQIVEKYVKEDR